MDFPEIVVCGRLALLWKVTTSVVLLEIYVPLNQQIRKDYDSRTALKLIVNEFKMKCVDSKY